jgi:hypothetical protein
MRLRASRSHLPYMAAPYFLPVAVASSGRGLLYKLYNLHVIVDLRSQTPQLTNKKTNSVALSPRANYTD